MGCFKGLAYFLATLFAAFLTCFLTNEAITTRNFPGFLTMVRSARVETLMRSLAPVTGSTTSLLVTLGLKVLLVWRLEWETLKPVDFFFPES